jgi:hypothetical protein
MSHAEKSEYYQRLKAAGVQFDKPYREYTTAELKEAVDLLDRHLADSEPEEFPQERLFELPDSDDPQPSIRQQVAESARVLPQQKQGSTPTVDLRDELAGLRQNTHTEGQPLRTDENGLIWYQDEVRKPATPKPRGRRVIRYMDTGTKKETVVAGQYIETFEVAGDAQRESEVKITLPSYQTGIYKDPRFPFKIHVYNENRGFDLFDVINFYGGADLVPTEIKRVYVENDLCYDIRTTIRAIETEARQLRLAGVKGL